MRLLGGLATVPEVICEARRGPTLAYLPAVAVPREVWLSGGFQRECADLAAILNHVACLDCSAWSIIGSADEFEYAENQANAKNRNATILAVATQVECEAIARNRPAFFSRHVFPFEKFLAFVTRPDVSNWRDGM